MIPESKMKGDIGATQVIASLVKKGYVVFTPLVCEALHFDLIAYKDDVFFKIQCKYSANGIPARATNWSDRNGSHKRLYEAGDFDFYGLYLPDIDKVIFPSIKYAGKHIRSDMPKSNVKFYWWEDFLDFTVDANTKTLADFGLKVPFAKRNRQANKPPVLEKVVVAIKKSKSWIPPRVAKKKVTILCAVCQTPFDVVQSDSQCRKHCSYYCAGIANQKVARPTSEELNKLLWEKPTLAIAKDFGVSDKAIEKWSKSYGLTKPPRGYWAKQASLAAKQIEE